MQIIALTSDVIDLIITLHMVILVYMLGGYDHTSYIIHCHISYDDMSHDDIF
jgi:hypothetical protein